MAVHFQSPSSGIVEEYGVKGSSSALEPSLSRSILRNPAWNFLTWIDDSNNTAARQVVCKTFFNGYKIINWALDLLEAKG